MLRFLRRDARPFDDAAQSALRPYAGVLAALLYARGVETAAQADAFLHPSLADLHGPLRLSGMAEAVALLGQAKAEGWPTVVYGDYDADGVCAAAVATEALRTYGVAATPHLPLRAEGYGLNLAAVEALARDYRLLVTVDLGITNAAEVERARELGMKVIVTDHHQPGLAPCPADAVVNPVLGDYPFPRLCGAGVAFKLAWALLGRDAAEAWLDLAALATVADIVPLIGENRVLVACGLPHIGQRPGLSALMDAAGCRPPLTAETVAYQLAPRINAAGRIADANLSLRLLMTRDPAEADALARKLDAANAERKRLEAEATAEASLQAETHDFVRNRVLFVRGEGWSSGVVGLVAGKLNQRYGVPVCALTGEEGLLHGSLRGVPGVNLARCLQTCDDLLLRYGGHEMAAGVTLEAGRDADFRERLERAVRLSAADDVFVPAQTFDLPLRLSQADDALLDALSQMEPFGFGNPAPVFYTAGAGLARRRACGAQGAHLQLTLRDGDRLLDGVAFGQGAQAARLPDAVDAAYTLARETFMGKVSIKCHVEALRPAAQAQAARLSGEPEAAFENALLRLLRDVQAAYPQPAPAGPAREAAPGGQHDPAALPLAHANGVMTATATSAFPTVAAGNPALGAEVNKAALDGSGAPAAAETPPRDAPGSTAAQGDFGLPVEALLAGRQGTLWVAYARDTAARFLAAYGEKVDLAVGRPEDPRCFHTLLVQPEPRAVRGRWRTVALLDGCLTPADAAFWVACVPGATVLAASPSPALRHSAAAIDAGDGRYRDLYRLLRASAFGSLRQAAAQAALSEAQTLAGLTAFDALGLIRLSEAPFHYTLCEPNRCSLAESPVLGALRALSAPKEARKC